MTENRLFQKGDYVIYKNNGVCLIEDIRPLPFGPSPDQEYFILRPRTSEGTIYVPVQGDMSEKLNKIPSRTEIDEIIRQAEHSDLEWIENSKVRIVAFDKLLASGDRVSILWLVKMLTEKKKNHSKNKRLCANEERILSTAKKIITDEFAFALNLPGKEVIPYILERIKT